MRLLIHDHQSSEIYHRLCGGAVYNVTFLITAGHCLHLKREWVKFYGIQVLAGDLHINNQTVFTVKRFSVHPNYNWKTHFANIAMIEVSTLNIQPLRSSA